MKDTAVRAVEAAGLSKTYPGGVRALDGLSLRVEPGNVLMVWLWTRSFRGYQKAI